MASCSTAREKPRALRANDGTNPKFECFTWITRNGEELQVSTPKPLQRSTIPSHKFLNFTTVLGPARQGKSFLMNCLVGNSVFRTSDNIGVCTKGIQLANVVHDVGNGGCAFFVDTEGQGDKDVESDATLLTPVILLSKVILFNWKGALQKNQILNELAILVEVGNCVSSNSFKQDASIFGHLHIVLRDFHFQGSAEEALAIIFDKEKMKERKDEKAKERNRIREKILSSFQSIDVCLIPVPCEDVRDLNLGATSEKFQKSVKELKIAILRQMSQPRRFGTFVVNLQNVDNLVRKFVKELEDGNIVHVKSAISQLQREVVDKAKRKFEGSLIKAYKEIHVPMKDGLERLLIQKRDAHLQEFTKSTEKIDLEAVYMDDARKYLYHFADRERDAKKKENQLAIQFKEAKQNKILAKEEEQFRSSMETELRRCQEGSIQMQQRFQEHKQRLVDNFFKRTANLDWIPECRKKKLEELKTWASARLQEKVEAKNKEEKYANRSKQQVCLTRAADDFRLGVESELAKNQSTSISNLPRALHQKMEKLIKIFQKDTDALHGISELTEAELEKLKGWAKRRIEEKVRAVEEETRRLENERERVMVELRKQFLFSPASYEQHHSPHWDSSAAPQPTPELQSYNAEPEQPRELYFSPAATSPSCSRKTLTPTDTGLKYYKGGQFTPGGGRAPKNGCFMYPDQGYRSHSETLPPELGLRHYSGGQFTPGGG